MSRICRPPRHALGGPSWGGSIILVIIVVFIISILIVIAVIVSDACEPQRSLWLVSV